MTDNSAALARARRAFLWLGIALPLVLRAFPEAPAPLQPFVRLSFARATAVVFSDKLLLRQILKEIEAYIKPLGLRLNGKTQILPLKNGIDFLGFHTYLTQTGKVVRKVRAKSIDNMKRKIRKFRGLVDSGKMTLDSVVQSYASWTGHISHGNTYHLRQNMDAYFFSYFPELKPSPKGDTTHGPKTEQPRKQVEGQVRQPVRQPDRLDRGR